MGGQGFEIDRAWPGCEMTLGPTCSFPPTPESTDRVRAPNMKCILPFLAYPVRRGPDGAAAGEVAGLFEALCQVQVEGADFVGAQGHGDGLPPSGPARGAGASGTTTSPMRLVRQVAWIAPGKAMRTGPACPCHATRRTSGDVRGSRGSAHARAQAPNRQVRRPGCRIGTARRRPCRPGSGRPPAARHRCA